MISFSSTSDDGGCVHLAHKQDVAVEQGHEAEGEVSKHLSEREDVEVDHELVRVCRIYHVGLIQQLKGEVWVGEDVAKDCTSRGYQESVDLILVVEHHHRDGSALEGVASRGINGCDITITLVDVDSVGTFSNNVPPEVRGCVECRDTVIKAVQRVSHVEVQKAHREPIDKLERLHPQRSHEAQAHVFNLSEQVQSVLSDNCFACHCDHA